MWPSRLPEELSADETALSRFLAETKAAGKLAHPNAVGIYEVDQEGDAYYLVMEYVGGGTIAEELERAGSLSVLEATRITANGCRGLATFSREAVRRVGRSMGSAEPVTPAFTRSQGFSLRRPRATRTGAHPADAC